MNTRGYKLLLQQEPVNHEIVIWWKTFISAGDSKGCHVKKKASLIKLSHVQVQHARKTFPVVILVEQAEASNIPPM